MRKLVVTVELDSEHDDREILLSIRDSFQATLNLLDYTSPVQTFMTSCIEGEFYIHKYEECQNYGGPEEGGWWYDSGTPVEDWQALCFTDEEEAYEKCRELNAEERQRRETLPVKYTDYYSSSEEFYTFDVSTDSTPHPYPSVRPHYE